MPRLLLLCCLAAGCVPWNHVQGPTVGGGIVYEQDRGVSPQLTAGYAYERYKSWYGYAGDAQIGWEPWRERVTATALARGSILFWEIGVGPAATWSPDGSSVGITFQGGPRIALGARNTCMLYGGGSGCIGEDDTVQKSYLPRVHGGFVWTHDGTFTFPITGDLVIGQQHLHL